MDLITCEVRFQEDETRESPGRLVGTLLTYGERASDRPETFDPGALYFPKTGIVVNEQHQRSQPILRTMPTTTGKAVVLDQPFPDTTRGRDAATMMREGVLTGLSVEFYPEKETRRNGLRVIQRAFVPRAGLVDDPSYSGSKAEVRAQGDLQRLLLSARLYL